MSTITRRGIRVQTTRKTAKPAAPFAAGLASPTPSDRAWWAAETSATPVRSTDRLVRRNASDEAWNRHIDALYTEYEMAEACFGLWW